MRRLELWRAGVAQDGFLNKPGQPQLPVAEVRGGWSGAAWGVDFQARAGWRYRLERAELADGPWLTVTNWAATQTASARLTDPAPPATRGFYRVGAEKP